MKFFSTSLLNTKILALSLFFCLPMVVMAQVIFTQDFSDVASNPPTSTFVNSLGEADKFNFIGAANGSSAYLNGNRLLLQRGGGTAAATRTTAFSSSITPIVLEVKFKLDVDFCSAYTTNLNAVFYVGSGFTPSSASEAAYHSRFGVSYPANSKWTIRNGGTIHTTTYDIDSPQDISWYINNSGSTFSYSDPAGGTTMLANDVADVWIGTTRAFAAIAALTPTQSLDNIKFYLNNNQAGAVVIDNIVITALDAVLPVSLSNFKANKTGVTNQLTWTTESETNNKGYDIQRQNQSGAWETLGFVNGNGKASIYTFEDKTPLSISYYRLRQVDFDGTETLSKVVSVSQSTKGHISLTPNPTSDNVNIQLNQNHVLNATTTAVLYDMTGRQVLTQSTTSEAFQLDLSNLAKGMYMLTVQSNNAVYQEKIIRQ